MALTVHEFSHALAATMLGDPTAKQLGRLSLNPFAHIDWFGLVALVLVSFGWGKPVPFNPYKLKNQKWGPLLIGIVGPISNLLLLSVSAILLKILMPLLGWQNLLVVFLSMCFLINSALMLFNLIPLPPLDGSKVVLALLHNQKWYRLRESIERYGSMVLFGLILVDIVLGIGIISSILKYPFAWIANLFGLNGIV